MEDGGLYAYACLSGDLCAAVRRRSGETGVCGTVVPIAGFVAPGTSTRRERFRDRSPRHARTMRGDVRTGGGGGTGSRDSGRSPPAVAAAGTEGRDGRSSDPSVDRC